VEEKESSLLKLLESLGESKTSLCCAAFPVGWYSTEVFRSYCIGHGTKRPVIICCILSATSTANQWQIL